MCKKIALFTLLISFAIAGKNGISSKNYKTDESLAIENSQKIEKSSVNWKNFRLAFFESLKTGKPIFLIVSQQSCRFCKILKNRIESNSYLSTVVQEYFIPVYADIHENFLPIEVLEKVDVTPMIFVLKAKRSGDVEISEGPIFGAVSETSLKMMIEDLVAASVRK